MTPPDQLPEETDLTAAAFASLVLEPQFHFARLSPDLQILQASAGLGSLAFPAVPREALVGRHLTDIFDEFVGSEETLQQVMNGNLPLYCIGKVNRALPDGDTAYYDFTVFPYRAGCPSEGLLLVIQDVTQVGRLEQELIQERNDLRLARADLLRANHELQRLNQLKTLFLSIAAHDLRAPLSAIQGYAEMLAGERTEDRDTGQRAWLSIICSQAVMMDQLISDILDLDLIERGKLQISTRTCDISQIVQAVTAGMRGLAEQKQLSLHASSPHDDCMLVTDPQRMHQILYNLVSNSIKYTDPGGRIELRCWREPQAVVIKVEDSGRGIPEEQMKFLFQLYHRTDDARRSAVRGTGLGLFIVKSVVDALGGQIEVQSQPGQGTAFRIALPIQSEPGRQTDYQTPPQE